MSFMKITKSDPPIVYAKTFKPGDSVRAKKTIDFCDGTWHHKGDIYPVTSQNVNYYNVCADDYEKV